MTRYELIMHDVEKMASEMPYNEQYPFKFGYLKREIRYLCEEIELLEERCGYLAKTT